MSKPDLNKIKIGVSPITGTAYLYRHGEDEEVALDKRELSMFEVFNLLVELMKFSKKKINVWTLDKKDKSIKYKITVEELEL